MAKYFREDEILGLDPSLVERLDAARELCGFPFTITSGKRSPDDNNRVGGVEDSSHILGVAVDLRVPMETTLREKMIWALGLAGFKRIGIYTRHLHVDIDESKTQNVAWFGESH